MPFPSLRLGLTVEVHDVSGATWPEVKRLLGVLDDLGIHAPTLLVVPRHETGEGRPSELDDCPQLVDCLHDRLRAGAELVLHGLTHRAPGPPPRGARNWLMHHWFSRGQAELAHLERAQAAGRLVEGRRLLAACGLRAEGFIAPAWQQSPGAFQAVVEAGFAFTAFLGRVVPLGGQAAPFASPVLTFCAPGPLVDHPKRIIMRGLETLAHRAPLVRVALHPEDVHAPGRLGHIATRLGALTEERVVVRYADYLDSRRDGAGARRRDGAGARRCDGAGGRRRDGAGAQRRDGAGARRRGEHRAPCPEEISA